MGYFRQYNVIEYIKAKVKMKLLLDKIPKLFIDVIFLPIVMN